MALGSSYPQRSQPLVNAFWNLVGNRRQQPGIWGRSWRNGLRSLVSLTHPKIGGAR